MPLLRPDILVIGQAPAGIELALGAALARVPVVLVTQGAVSRAPGGREPLNRLAALGVRIIEGEARFRDRVTLQAADVTLAPRRTVLALSARRAPPAIEGLQQAPHWQPGQPATAVLALGAARQVPALLQAARCEGHRAATVYSGARLLEGYDTEAAAVLENHLRRAGADLHAGVPLEGARVERCPEGFLLHPAGGGAPVGFSHWCGEAVLPPDFATLACEEAGIAFEAGYPRLGRGLSTTNGHVLALGPARSAEVDDALARAEAGIALAAILFRRAPEPALARLPRLVPGALCLLEAGEDEAAIEARARGRTQWFREPLPLGGSLKAVTDSAGQILRLVVLGKRAPLLAAPLLELMALGRPLQDLAGLALPQLQDAASLSALGVQALAGRLRAPGTQQMMRLLRWLG